MPELSVEGIKKKQARKQEKSKEEVPSTSIQLSIHKKNRQQTKTGFSQHTLFSQSGKDSSIVTETQKRMNRIDDLYDKLIKTQDNYIKALLLIDLNNQLFLFNIDLEKETSLTSTHIEALSKIEAKVIDQAKSLLQMALLKGDYDLARILSSFYGLISNDILVIALMQKNANLLTFLAKDLGLPINSYPINIKERSYSNAVQYCFLECIGSDSLLDCFSVLIKQGAQFNATSRSPIDYL